MHANHCIKGSVRGEESHFCSGVSACLPTVTHPFQSQTSREKFFCSYIASINKIHGCSGHTCSALAAWHVAAERAIDADIGWCLFRCVRDSLLNRFVPPLGWTFPQNRVCLRRAPLHFHFRACSFSQQAGLPLAFGCVCAVRACSERGSVARDAGRAWQRRGRRRRRQRGRRRAAGALRALLGRGRALRVQAEMPARRRIGMLPAAL